MPIGAAIGAAGLGAAGSVAGSLIQSGAASDAAAQQAQAAQAALAQQKQMFGVAQKALNPYINAGTSALPTLQSLITPGTSADTLKTLPGFQFQSQWGDLAATNQLAAQGLGGSAGPLGKALSDYNQGLAGTYYTNSVNALQGFASMGQGAAGSLAGNAINSGNSMAGTIQNQGNALAAGTLGSANAIAGGISGATNSLGGISNALLLSKLFGGASGSSGAFSGGAAPAPSYGGS